MAWRSVSLLDATKSPFMLVLPVAAPHQYQKWQVEDFAYIKSRESRIPSDADTPFSIVESVKLTEAGHPDRVALYRTCCDRRITKTASSHRRAFIYTTPWH
jgi:hypothetical protein